MRSTVDSNIIAYLGNALGNVGGAGSHLGGKLGRIGMLDI